MKRKLVTLLLSLCMLFGITGLAACSVDTGTSTESTSSSVESGSPEEGAPENGTPENEGETHTHAYAFAKKDATHHWTECECGDTTEKIEHVYVGEWQKDKTQHWKSCSCGATNKDTHITGAVLCSACQYSLATEGLKYTLSNDETYYSVTGMGTATETDIIISETYKELPVKSIGAGAFRDDILTSIIIPDNVTCIEDKSLAGCNDLQSVTFSENSRLTSIENAAFSGCRRLTNISIPNSVISIGSSAFSGCRRLTNISIPNSVISIGYSAFSECNIAIQKENGVDYLGKWAIDFDGSVSTVSLRTDTIGIASQTFAFNTNLTNISIPDSVAYIGEQIFHFSHNLTNISVGENNAYYQSIDGNLYTKDGKTLIKYPAGKTMTEFTIPDSVTTIGEEAFFNCSLRSIVVPKEVTSIRDNAFGNCNLRNAYYEGTESDWNNVTIDDFSSNLEYAIRYYSEAEPTGEGNFWHYVDGVPTVWE